MEFFPETAIVNALDSTWHPTATSIYRNWLQYIIARKAETSNYTSTQPPSRKGVALSS
jgi:homoserine trans-succinylase